MEINAKLDILRKNVNDNLQNIIIPFWRDNMLDDVHGGFYGSVDRYLKPDTESPKAFVLNARLLWYYSHMFESTGEPVYMRLAQRSYDYNSAHFWDKTFGGAFWLVSSNGDPLEIEKHTYAQAFMIFSMSEYYRVFGEQRALDMAMETFNLLESRVHIIDGGYFDTASRDWTIDKLNWRWAMNAGGCPKVVNSQMHLLESYIALLKANENQTVRDTLDRYLRFFTDNYIDTGRWCMKAGMDLVNTRLDDDMSFGHDSECCYLINDAAGLLGDTALIAKCREITLKIMERVVKEGIDPQNGGLYYERYFERGSVNKCKMWWTQCEGMTGIIDAYGNSGNELFLDALINIWNYIDRNMIDREYGEWLALGENKVLTAEDSRLEQLVRNRVGDVYAKASRTKCPYHNGKACMELIRRIDAIKAK